MKNNNKLSRKIFKISQAFYAQQQKEVVKKYSFKKISTRKYYKGLHRVVIIINGHELLSDEFAVQ
jgi:hypothetical protein